MKFQIHVYSYLASRIVLASFIKQNGTVIKKYFQIYFILRIVLFNGVVTWPNLCIA